MTVTVVAGEFGQSGYVAPYRARAVAVAYGYHYVFCRKIMNLILHRILHRAAGQMLSNFLPMIIEDECRITFFARESVLNPGRTVPLRFRAWILCSVEHATSFVLRVR